MKKVKDFCELLKGFRINYILCNPYHVQVQVVHNFYPTKQKYYNSLTNERFIYPDFKNVNEFLKFLGDNVGDVVVEKRFKTSEIVDLLEGASNLESAIKYFKTL